MRPEEIMELLRRQPFVPLRFHMTDGRTYDIRHPDSVIVLRQALDIGVVSDPDTGVAERVQRCSLLHVVRVEEMYSATARTGNGAG